MKKKITLFLVVCLICLCCVGCENKNDNVEIINRGGFTFDNINIKIKNGYFYDGHEKFTVDKDTIGLTIYFSNENEDTWD